MLEQMMHKHAQFQKIRAIVDSYLKKGNIGQQNTLLTVLDSEIEDLRADIAHAKALREQKALELRNFNIIQKVG